MKYFITLFVIFAFTINIIYWYEWQFWPIKPQELRILNFWDNTCKPWTYDEKDIPTIFIPWILASWYSEEWNDKENVKRWIPDPITHVYDPLFFTFKRAWYRIADVFYKDQFNLDIVWDPKWSLYLFGYDWKKDNKITATLLTQLIWKIYKKYEKYNWCNIWKVNIIAHSMWWLVARAMLEDICVKYWKNNGEYKTISKYNSDEKEWTLETFTQTSCTNPYPTPSTWTKIIVNNLITISTPHRWSPKSLPLWEKWNLDQVEKFFVAIPLQIQLWSITNKSLYKTIHW